MKERLDVLLVEQGFFPSREKAKATIMAGDVFVNGQREDKAGSTFGPQKSTIEVRAKKLAYVSRGGLKLEKAVQVFRLNFTGMTCLDIGSSTGGFTDCMLQNGAEKVYAVDVGRGQLDWKLRQDPRVVSMEKTNFRYVTRQQIPDPIDFACCDVAFISLRLILGPAFALLREGAQMVCLIKPQFEAGRDKVGKKGVVRDKGVHRDVILMITEFAVSSGFRLLALDYSPIRGPEGNIEYLLYMEKPAAGESGPGLVIDDAAAASVVEAAHAELE